MSTKKQYRDRFLDSFKPKTFSLGEWARLEMAFDAGWRTSREAAKKRAMSVTPTPQDKGA